MLISKEGYEDLIDTQDELLKIISRHIKHECPKESQRWTHKLNFALDERLRLMKLRDNAKSNL